MKPQNTCIHLPLYKNFSMQVVNVDSGTAPITASFFSPFLKTITVGILRIPYWVAIPGLSSVLTLYTLSFPAYCLASLSMTGWIMRHGPHHGAQNSTKTGASASSTRDCQVESVTAGASTAVSCASQTILLPSRAFRVELSLTEERVGWILSPLN